MATSAIAIEADHASSSWLRARELALANLTKTSVRRWAPDKPYGMNVAVVTPLQQTRWKHIVYPMSHDYRIDQLVLRRLSVLASVLGSAVVAVETPAITMNFVDPADTGRSRLPTRVVVDLLRGHYERVAALQYSAMQDVFGLELSDASLIGESMGAQMAVAMASIVAPRSLDLVEPINCQSMSLVKLYLAARSLQGPEADLKRRYVEDNARHGWGIARPFELGSKRDAQIDAKLKKLWNQGLWSLVSAMGLRYAIDRNLAEVELGSVGVWRARESSVCAERDVDQLAARQEHRGPQVLQRVITLTDSPAGHHVLTNLNALVGFALALKAHWSGDEANSP